MLGKENRLELKYLMQISIGGLVVKSDLKEWLLELQKQKHYFCSECDTKDLENIAKELNIKVVSSKAEYNKICHKYKCFYSVPALDTVVEKEGKVKKIVIDGADVEIIRRMYQDENRSANDIALMYHVGLAKVYQFLKENKIKLKFNTERNKGKVTEKDLAVCQELKKQGWTYKAIAEKYGVTRQYMQEKLQKKRFDIYKENARLSRELKEKENEIMKLKEMLNLKEAI